VARLILGVTGNVASGKSAVARMLHEKGCALVDADKVAHELYAAHPALVRQVAQEFGDEFVHPDGTLNRKRLGSRVFGDPAALAALNRIVHPHLVVALRERVFSALRVMNRVVVDAALIVEWGAHREADALVLVTAPEPLRLARLMERDGLSQDEAERRIRSQMPEEEKRPYAGFEIVNTGSHEDLQRQVDEVWEKIEAAEKEEN
jgi:dephospho-CoA kinase